MHIFRNMLLLILTKPPKYYNPAVLNITVLSWADSLPSTNYNAFSFYFVLINVPVSYILEKTSQEVFFCTILSEKIN